MDSFVTIYRRQPSLRRLLGRLFQTRFLISYFMNLFRTPSLSILAAIYSARRHRRKTNFLIRYFMNLFRTPSLSILAAIRSTPPPRNAQNTVLLRKCGLVGYVVTPLMVFVFAFYVICIYFGHRRFLFSPRSVRRHRREMHVQSY